MTIELIKLDDDKKFEVIAKNHITGMTKDYLEDTKEFTIEYHISDGRNLVGYYKKEDERNKIFDEMREKIWGDKN